MVDLWLSKAKEEVVRGDLFDHVSVLDTCGNSAGKLTELRM